MEVVTLEKLFYFAKPPLEDDCLDEFIFKVYHQGWKVPSPYYTPFFFPLYFDPHQNKKNKKSNKIFYKYYILDHYNFRFHNNNL
jgi:hypothetical protein